MVIAAQIYILRSYGNISGILVKNTSSLAYSITYIDTVQHSRRNTKSLDISLDKRKIVSYRSEQNISVSDSIWRKQDRIILWLYASQALVNNLLVLFHSHLRLERKTILLIYLFLNRLRQKKSVLYCPTRYADEEKILLFNRKSIHEIRLAEIEGLDSSWRKLNKIFEFTLLAKDLWILLDIFKDMVEIPRQIYKTKVKVVFTLSL